MASKLNIHDFDIDLRTIPPEVEVLHNSLSKARKTKLKKNYESAYDFLVILFHLRFIEQLQTSQIAEKLRCRQTNVDIHLYNFAWDYSSDYIENRQRFKEKMTQARNALLESKERSHTLDEDQNPKLKEALKKVKSLNKKSYLELGFETAEEYAQVLYYLLYCCKDITPIVLCQLFSLTYGATHRRLKVLGLNKSHQEGMIKKQRIGSQDYERSHRHGRIVRKISQLQNFSTGSKIEDYFRSQLADVIYEHIPSKRYEAIVGLSNVGILGELEIDIPLVVYDIEKKAIHRFAIEYNGKYYHTGERDRNKEILCESKGCHYLAIVHEGHQYSNKPELLNPILHETCKKIKKMIITE